MSDLISPYGDDNRKEALNDSELNAALEIAMDQTEFYEIIRSYVLGKAQAKTIYQYVEDMAMELRTDTENYYE